MSLSSEAINDQLAGAVTRAEAAEKRATFAEELTMKERQRADDAAAQARALLGETEAANARTNELTRELRKVEVEASKVCGLEDKVRDREDEIAALSSFIERVIHPAQQAVREAAALRQVVRVLRSNFENEEDARFWRGKYETLQRQVDALQKASRVDAEDRSRVVSELERLLGHHQKLSEERIASSERQIASMRDSYYGVASWFDNKEGN